MKSKIDTFIRNKYTDKISYNQISNYYAFRRINTVIRELYTLLIDTTYDLEKVPVVFPHIKT